MPRRNQRRESCEPLDLTPADIPRARRPRPLSPGHTYVDREAAERERRERQANARINGGIDWTLCLVPGCGKELFAYGQYDYKDPKRRDHLKRLPLCTAHLLVAFNQAKMAGDDGCELVVKTNAMLLEMRRAEAEARDNETRKQHMARTDGHLYAVRLNGLIKLGWSREVNVRIHQYGPQVEVLAVWPGTRDDETLMHRQFAGSRARGREWYEDSKVLHDFVASIIERHGQPAVRDMWSKPPEPVIRRRKR